MENKIKNTGGLLCETIAVGTLIFDDINNTVEFIQHVVPVKHSDGVVPNSNTNCLDIKNGREDGLETDNFC